MNCKSTSLCKRCAKVYVDTWVSQVSQMLHEGIIYRHLVLTMHTLLRITFYQHARALLNPLLRCGVPVIWMIVSAGSSGRPLKGGPVVSQRHGRNDW